MEPKNSELSIGNLVSWGLAVILALAFINSGWINIFPSEQSVQQVTQYGYSIKFATAIGILEIMGGLLVLIPRLSSIGGVILAVVMAGAIYTHIATSIGKPGYAIILLILCVPLIILRWKQTIFFRRGGA
jgi:uncharacterized membrane protein YphA (DoxX/SURF4 family)